MTSQKVIAVVGATGAQGGSVVKHLLSDSTFSVRALTRDISSQSAKDLQAAGAEVVAADMEDIASLEKAFSGAYGVFAITVWSLYPVHGYDAQATQAHEEQHGRNLVDAGLSAGVKHFLWSTLDHTPGILCPHFESKYNIDEYLKSTPLPRTSFYTSFYFENLTKYGLLKKDETTGGFLVDIRLPAEAKLPSYSVADTGAWVLEALKDPKTWIGKDMDVVSDSPTVGEYAEAVRKISNDKPVTNHDMTYEQYVGEANRQQMGEEMWLGMKLFAQGLSVRDINASKSVNPRARTLLEFIEEDVALKAFVA